MCAKCGWDSFWDTNLTSYVFILCKKREFFEWEVSLPIHYLSLIPSYPTLHSLFQDSPTPSVSSSGLNRTFLIRNCRNISSIFRFTTSIIGPYLSTLTHSWVLSYFPSNCLVGIPPPTSHSSFRTLFSSTGLIPETYCGLLKVVIGLTLTTPSLIRPLVVQLHTQLSREPVDASPT